MLTPPVRGRRSPSAYRQFLSLSLAALLIFSGGFLFSVSRFSVVHADTGTGSVSLATLNTTVGPENFNTLANTGTTNTTLPAGWYITETGGGARDNEAYAADNGVSTTGDTYSYGSGTTTPSTERALGGLRTGTLAPFFGAKFTNNTGTLVNTLDITYTGEEWRLGAAARTDRLDFQISTDATDLSTGSYANVDSLDFTTPSTTGTAGLRDGNVAPNRTVITATISNLNIPSGTSFFIRWTDFDPSGSDDGLAVDDFSITPRFADTAPTVTSTTPSNGATGVSLGSNITVTFSEPVNAAAAFTINCATSGAHPFVLTGGPTVFTLNPDTNFSPNEVCTVTVDDAQVTDQDSVDPPDNMAADFVFSFTTVDTASCGATFTPTYTIQGSGATTPIPGTQTTEGVVVGDFQGSAALSGFYIQDPSGDANTATSDGLYVFDGGTPSVDVAAGDRVRVTGTVAEFSGKTQITPGTVIVCSTGNSLPPPTVYDLPEPVDGDLERVEHMLVTFTETLTVTGNFTLGRFGELVLSSDGREFHETNFNRPNSPGALATRDLNARRYVLLDDGRFVQNPDPTPFFDANNTRRTGDTVANLTGILTFDFSEYRVQPTVAPTFAAANPRTAVPDPVGGNVKLSSFNVLNYFNGNGAGGGFPTSRGATTAAEFNRQRDKIIAAIKAINADVYGIIEIENDGNGSTSAIQDLVNGLNATEPGTYAFTEGTVPGTDEIKNSIIYKTASVTTVGPAVNDDDPAWTGQARNPLAQTFTLNSNGEKFTYIVNHFTSKSCSTSDTGLDADQLDGQACDNLTRTNQSKRLLVFVNNQQAASGDNDVLVMGDLNAYGEEDPIITLEDDATDSLGDGPGGLINLVEKFVPAPSRYSFQFQSKFGYLDHALATKELDPRVSGTTIWHINADEPVYIDYNVEFKSAAQQAVNQGTPYKSSDHDPVVVGLNLSASAPTPAGSLVISEFRFRGPGSGDNNAQHDEFIEFYNNTNSDISVSATDGSAGWALVAADGQTRFIIPAGTVIPARAHFLGVNSAGYSLSGYRAGVNSQQVVFASSDAALLDGDVTTAAVDPAATFATGDTILLADGATPASGYTSDIPDASGVALFRTSNPVNFTLANRLDAAGYVGVPELYREGAGFPTDGAETAQNLQYTFFRSMTRTTGGLPKDTGNNAADFLSADTAATPGLGQGRKLGAPGPENLTSPIERSANMPTNLLNPSVGSTLTPNRVRTQCAQAPECNPTTAQFGTISIRRTVTNNTGSDVAQLRFRIVEVTTLPRASTSDADVRALDSEDIVVTVNGNPVNVRGTQVEQPPSQPLGGGWNSSMNVGFITLNAPLIDGDSVSVQFMLGVQQTGNYRFFLNVEANPSPPVNTEVTTASPTVRK